jgi:hypothetical protein
MKPLFCCAWFMDEVPLEITCHSFMYYCLFQTQIHLLPFNILLPTTGTYDSSHVIHLLMKRKQIKKNANKDSCNDKRLTANDLRDQLRLQLYVLLWKKWGRKKKEKIHRRMNENERREMKHNNVHER